MQYAPTLPGENSSGFRFVFIRGIKNRIRIGFIRPLVWPSVGRMLLRPYTGDLKNGDFSIRSASGVAVCGAYAIRPYTGTRKNGDFSIRSTTGMVACGACSIRPYPDGQKPGRVSVRFYPMKTKMAGDSMVRHPRKGVWGCPILVVRFLDHMPGLHFEVAVDDIDG